jgi:hypothetical protein
MGLIALVAVLIASFARRQGDDVAELIGILLSAAGAKMLLVALCFAAWFLALALVGLFRRRRP